jgi:prepilin-type N-terminal cleavage/methylation domain-containing protein
MTSRGQTLIELIVVLAISSLIFGAIMLTTSSSLQAMDHISQRNGVDQAALHAVNRISIDLGTALELKQTDPTTLKLTVPDITGDAVDDEIVYSWSGTAGAPLLRSVNGTPLPIAENVSACLFEYLQGADQARGIVPEDALEVNTVAEFWGFPTEAGTVYSTRPQLDLTPGRVLRVTFVAQADAEMLVRISFRAMKYLAAAGIKVTVVDPADTAQLAEGQISGASLGFSIAQCDVLLTGQAPDGRGIRAGRTYYILMTSSDPAIYGGTVEYDRIKTWAAGVTAWNNQFFFQFSSNGGATWADYGDTADLLFNLSGAKRRLHGRTDTITATLPKAVDVTIGVAEGLYRANQHARVRLLNF